MTERAQPGEKTGMRARLKSRLSGLRRVSEPGAAPGTLKPMRDSLAPSIHVFAYGADGLAEHEAVNIEELAGLRPEGGVLWIDVVGLGDVGLVQSLGDMFGLHRLALEDVVNVHQRPKAEEYDGHTFIVARMLHSEAGGDSEQVSLFLGRDYLITFQERKGDSFDAVRRRLREGRGRIRSSPPDYLCYALLDAIIDGYFPVLEAYGERLEDIEDQVVMEPAPEHVQVLHDLKRDLLMIRRSVWPLREMINALTRDEHALFSDATRLYLRDCYDHAIQLMDIVETYREIASGLIDVYISSVGAKMNEVMKVLTIIATIFIPLGFIAGVYGMNFDPQASPWNMPELGWRYGYPAVLMFMAACAGGMVYYFWRKGWIGEGPRRRGRRRG